MCHDEVLLRHDIIYQCIELSLETQVTISDDTHQSSFVIDHRNTSDMVFSHHGERIAHSASALDGHGVVDHAVFCTFHYRHLPCLFFDAHILVNHTYTTFARYGNCHRSLGNGVHCSSDERNVQYDVS